MRVYLGLERYQLRVLLFDVDLVYVVDQFVQLPLHMVESLGYIADLVFLWIVYGDVPVLLVKFFHHVDHFDQTVGKGSG